MVFCFRINLETYGTNIKTLVQIRNNHNHEVNVPAILKSSDVSEFSKKQLLDLFSRGYTPLSAHEILHFNAFMSHGSK